MPQEVANPFIVSFFGACFGGVVSLLVSLRAQGWKYRIDRATSLADEICKETIAHADMGSKYWLSPRKAGDSDMDLLRVQIQGGKERLDALKVPFENWCLHADLVHFQNAYGELVTAITGGEFTKASRKADPERALEIQIAAADVVAAARRSLANGVGLWSSVERCMRKNR